MNNKKLPPHLPDEDFDKEIMRIERERERKNKKISMLEKIRIEEETNKRQFELEIAKRKMIEEGLMKGKISFNTDVMNEFSRARFEDAMKKGDYKRAAVHLIPYVQDIFAKQAVANNI